MIDFHSHILPGIDDGSQNLEESIKMLYEQYKHGVQKVILTPHFYASRDSVDHFLKRRAECFSIVQEAVTEKNWNLKLYAGAEVYYFPDIGKAEDVSRLCLEGTSVLLLELPFCQWKEDMLKDVKRIIEKQNLTVLLAHIERYCGFQKDKGIWNQMMELPLYLQVNAGSFLKWKQRQFGFRLLREGAQIVLGSDCHNLERRPPNLWEGREAIHKKTGDEFLQDIDRLGERILNL